MKAQCASYPAGKSTIRQQGRCGGVRSCIRLHAVDFAASLNTKFTFKKKVTRLKTCAVEMRQLKTLI